MSLFTITNLAPLWCAAILSLLTLLGDIKTKPGEIDPLDILHLDYHIEYVLCIMFLLSHINNKKSCCVHGSPRLRKESKMCWSEAPYSQRCR